MTAVGIIGIVAGTVPILEVIAVWLSPRFAAWFLPLMRSILPVRDSLAFSLLFGIALADIGFGIGVLARKRVALYGMIVRSIAGVPVDYVNFAAGNRVGAFVGLSVNLFMGGR